MHPYDVLCILCFLRTRFLMEFVHVPEQMLFQKRQSLGKLGQMGFDPGDSALWRGMGICSHLLAHMGCGQPHLFGHLALSFCGVTCLLSRVAFALCRLALSFCRFPFVFRLLPLLCDSHGGYL